MYVTCNYYSMIGCPGTIRHTHGTTYRLDDGSRSLRDLFHRGNRCIDVPSAKREGVYFGFQGEINPVETDELSSKVFIPHTTLLFKLLKATSH